MSHRMSSSPSRPGWRFRAACAFCSRARPSRRTCRSCPDSWVAPHLCLLRVFSFLFFFWCCFGCCCHAEPANEQLKFSAPLQTMRNFVRNPNADSDLIHNLFGVKMLINAVGSRRMGHGMGAGRWEKESQSALLQLAWIANKGLYQKIGGIHPLTNKTPTKMYAKFIQITKLKRWNTRNQSRQIFKFGNYF